MPFAAAAPPIQAVPRTPSPEAQVRADHDVDFGTTLQQAARQQPSRTAAERSGTQAQARRDESGNSPSRSADASQRPTAARDAEAAPRRSDATDAADEAPADSQQEAPAGSEGPQTTGASATADAPVPDVPADATATDLTAVLAAALALAEPPLESGTPLLPVALPAATIAAGAIAPAVLTTLPVQPNAKDQQGPALTVLPTAAEITGDDTAMTPASASAATLITEAAAGLPIQKTPALTANGAPVHAAGDAATAPVASSDGIADDTAAAVPTMLPVAAKPTTSRSSTGSAESTAAIPAPGPSQDSGLPAASAIAAGAATTSTSATTPHAPSTASQSSAAPAAAAAAPTANARSRAPAPVAEQAIAQTAPSDAAPANAGGNAPAAATTAAPLATTSAPAPMRDAAPGDQPNALDRALAGQVARALVRTGHDGERQMTVRLTPPELGTIRITLVERGGALEAHLHAEDDGVRAAIDKMLPQLRGELRSSDSTVKEISLGDRPNDRGADGRSDGRADAERNLHDRQEQARDQQQGQGRSRARSFDEDEVPAAPLRSSRASRVSRDGVDLTA